MLFSIVAQDYPNSLAKRLAARPEHVARLTALDAAGRLVLAGPQPHPTKEGFTGSLIVADFENLTAAQDWAKADPYVTAGVYADVVIKPFKQVFPSLD